VIELFQEISNESFKRWLLRDDFVVVLEDRDFGGIEPIAHSGHLLEELSTNFLIGKDRAGKDDMV
jgi:hypothetical protein